MNHVEQMQRLLGRRLVRLHTRFKTRVHASSAQTKATAAQQPSSVVHLIHELETSHEPSPTNLATFSVTPSSSPPSFSVTSSNTSTSTLSHADSASICTRLLSRLTSSLPHDPLTHKNLTRQLSPENLVPVTIEYSSPNIAKPLHMGHLRSTLTGMYVRNMAEFAGHKTTSICFLGDWGRQFGVLHAGVLDSYDGTRDFSQFVQTLGLSELLECYIAATGKCEADKDFTAKAMKLSAQLESEFGTAETESTALWKHTRTLTVEHLNRCYESLGVRFHEFEGESTYFRESCHTSRALRMLEDVGMLVREEDGSVHVRTEGDKKAVLLKRDNSTVYLLRDIACALQRNDKYVDHHHVYVVDSGQAGHFRNLFTVIESLLLAEKKKENWSAHPFSRKHVYVPFGKVEGMSTRKGSFTLLSSVLDEGTALMHEARQKSKNARNVHDFEVSEKLAVSGLVVNALKVRRGRTYAFDWGEALRSNGNSGVALQYTAARLESLRARIGDVMMGVGDDTFVVEKHVRMLMGEGRRTEMLNLLVCILNFEESLWRSYASLEPCVLVAYSFHLADKVSRALAAVNVLHEEDDGLKDAYAWLFAASQAVLSACMRVIGMPPIRGGF